MNKFTEILKKTLEIINYQGDHLEFIEKFISRVYTNAILFMIKDLPEERHQELIDRFDDIEEVWEIEQRLNQSFNMEEFSKVINKEFEVLYYTYIKKLSEVLSEEKAALLEDYLKSKSAN